MLIDAPVKPVLSLYGLGPSDLLVKPLGSGLINTTWEVQDPRRDGHWVLQAINQDVFSSPEWIDQNVQALSAHLLQQGQSGLAVFPLKDLGGKTMVNHLGQWFRLFPYVSGSVVHETLNSPALAAAAARQFGLFTAALDGLDLQRIQPVLPGFHRLDLRYEQFEQALAQGNADRLLHAQSLVSTAQHYHYCVDHYQALVDDPHVPLRLQHHDTKISNVLFDASGKALVVIDLDTVMPGYFFSDLGDMLRTYLSPAGEESLDWDNVFVRPAYKAAVFSGYAEGLGTSLTLAERKAFGAAGAILIYMQALRFLTDYLLGDPYYKVSHPLHNFNRTKHQLLLLERYLQVD